MTEKVLAECHEIYSDKENGLIEIAKSLDLELLAPRKKVTVMIIGNHSAGKSSFINWYIEEHVQRAGVAIETQGFTIVTTGRKRESLTGNATMHLYPHFKPLTEIDGMINYLATEVTTSCAKDAPLCHLVDTPGLVDGEMKYPFDVNNAIFEMSNLADLVLVFFDPIGQALTKRTLDVVETVHKKYPEKIRFFLSKADEAGEESDRQRVLMQIVCDLCRRPSLNQIGFDMPTIYIENAKNSGRPKRCANQIQTVVDEIKKTINMTVQNTLNTLEVDCEKIKKMVDECIEEDDKNKNHNWKVNLQFLFYCAFICLLPCVFLSKMIYPALCETSDDSPLCIQLSKLKSMPDPTQQIINMFPPEQRIYSYFSIVAVWALAIIIVKTSHQSKSVLSRKDKKSLLLKAKYVNEQVLPKKESLYKEYLNESVGEF